MATSAIPTRSSDTSAAGPRAATSTTPRAEATRDADDSTPGSSTTHASAARNATSTVEGSPNPGNPSPGNPGAGNGGAQPAAGGADPGGGGASTPGPGAGSGPGAGTGSSAGGTGADPGAGDGTTGPTGPGAGDPSTGASTGGGSGGSTGAGAGTTTPPTDPTSAPGPGPGSPPTHGAGTNPTSTVPVAAGPPPAGSASPDPDAVPPRPPRRPADPPQPTPVIGLSLAALTPSVAATLPTDELVTRSHNTISSALNAAGAGGGGPAGAGIVMRLLESALQRDENGLTVFDAKEQSLVQERRRLEAELRRRGAAPDLVQRLLSNIIEQGMVQREREKIEGLLALMVSISFGNIPKGLVNRLVELGFGPEVQRAMREAIGNGRSLSRGAIRDLLALAQSGLGTGLAPMPDVGPAPEHQVEEYYRDEDRRIARAATATGRARLVDPRRPRGDEQPSTLSEALRARAVIGGWGAPASPG